MTTVTVTAAHDAQGDGDYLFRLCSWELKGVVRERWTLVRRGRRVVAKLRRHRIFPRLVVVDDRSMSEPGYSLVVPL